MQDDGLPAAAAGRLPRQLLRDARAEPGLRPLLGERPGPGRRRPPGPVRRGLGATSRRTSAAPRACIGFDLFNEPWPGHRLAAVRQPGGLPGLRRRRCSAFSQRVIDAIRAVDRRTTIFYEPQRALQQRRPDPRRRRPGRRLGFSFHDYCLTAEADADGVRPGACDAFDDLVFDNADEHVAATGHAPLLTEFGATTGPDDARPRWSTGPTAAPHRLAVLGLLRLRRPDDDRPGRHAGAGARPVASRRAATNVDRAKLRALAVPHPLRGGGHADGVRASTATRRVFRTTWSGRDRARGPGRFGAGQPHHARVPTTAYPHGYVVRVTGGRVVSRPGAPHVGRGPATGCRRGSGSSSARADHGRRLSCGRFRGRGAALTECRSCPHRPPRPRWPRR